MNKDLFDLLILTVGSKTANEKKNDFDNLSKCSSQFAFKIAIENIVSNGYKFTKTLNYNKNILMTLAHLDYHEIVDYLLTFDYIQQMLNDVDERGLSALYYACIANSKNTIDVLIKYGIDPNIQSEGDSPIFIASMFNHKEIVRKLLRYNRTNILLNNDASDNIMTEIVFKNQIELFDDLKKHKDFDINHQTLDGITMLMVASREGFRDFTRLLLNEKDINIEFVDDDSETALDKAILHNRKEIVKELLEHGANQFIYDDDLDEIQDNRFYDTNSPLRIAINDNMYEIIELLVEDYIKHVSFIPISKDILRHIIKEYLYN